MRSERVSPRSARAAAPRVGELEDRPRAQPRIGEVEPFPGEVMPCKTIEQPPEGAPVADHVNQRDERERPARGHRAEHRARTLSYLSFRQIGLVAGQYQVRRGSAHEVVRARNDHLDRVERNGLAPR
jgi:hypothetical protein